MQAQAIGERKGCARAAQYALGLQISCPNSKENISELKVPIRRSLQGHVLRSLTQVQTKPLSFS